MIHKVHFLNIYMQYKSVQYVYVQRVGELGLSMAVFYDCEAVLSESLYSQGFPEHWISHSAPVTCYSVLWLESVDSLQCIRYFLYNLV